MKKIIIAFIANFIFTICLGQIVKQGCNISYDYSSSAGWTIDKHLYNLNCQTNTLLTGTQTNHVFANNQLQLNNIQCGAMNRVYRSLGTTLGNTFITDFEAKIYQSPNNARPVYHLLALTENDLPPYADYPSSCTWVKTGNNAIIVWIGAANDIMIVSKYQTTDVFNHLGFVLNYNISYFFRLKRESISKLTFEVFADANRTNLIFRKNCIDIDLRITGLKFIQHANGNSAGFPYAINGYIANTCINTNPDFTCCTPRITGNNTVCEEETPTTYQVNAVAGNAYTWILPSGVTYTSNPANSQITITNWGTVTTIPKQVDIKVKMFCHCDSFTVSYSVFIYPKRDPNFNFNNIGNNGIFLNNFLASGSAGIAGTINQWEIFECDILGNQIGIKPLRNIGWQTSTGGLSTFNVIAKSISLSGVAPYPSISDVDYPWKDLVVAKYYLVKHIMYVNSNICSYRGKSRVLYISQSNKVYNLGEPNTVEFKANIEALRTFEKID
jgi:PKD-like domain